MYSKNPIILILSFFILSFSGLADEGMWPFYKLENKYKKMKSLGLQLGMEDLFNNNGKGVLNSIVKFGDNCSGFFISENGLLITSYHCGYKHIQEQSSLVENYIFSGYSANSKNEELPCENISVKIISQIQDITNSILAGLKENMTHEAKIEKINLIYEELVSQFNKKDYEFHELVEENGKYFIFSYLEFKDIRLVAAPPKSIGKFGGNEDNWAWPRHSGSFAIFRVYSSNNQNPAEFSTDNVPFKSQNFAKLSTDKKQEGDFTLTAGFPSFSDRHGNSWELQREEKKILPFNLSLLEGITEILKKSIQNDINLDLVYGEDLEKHLNQSKYYKTLINHLRKHLIVEKRKIAEDRLRISFVKNPDQKSQYVDATGIFISDIPKVTELNLLIILRNQLFSNNVAINTAARFFPLLKAMENNDIDQTQIQELKTFIENQKQINEVTEQDILSFILNFSYHNTNKDFHPMELIRAFEKFKGNFSKYAENACKLSIFTDKNDLLKFLNNPCLQTLERDPIFKMAFSFNGSVNKFTKILEQEIMQVEIAKKVYLQALVQQISEDSFYPEANGTPRFSYGKISDFYPCNATKYKWQTSLKGMMEKKDDESAHFYVSNKLIKLTKQGGFEKYLNSDGDLPICFITNNDILRACSGSPVLNSLGEAIGMVFDINKEAVGITYNYYKEKHRAIAVDSRFILFCLDKFFKNEYIMAELQNSND